MAMTAVAPAARRLAYTLDQKRIVEKLWRQFFSDPSQWWDHRLEKKNARYPDFKSKKTHEALWLNGILNPPWVEAAVAALPPGTVQLNIFSWNAVLSRYVKEGQNEKTLELFQKMQAEGINPDRFTFVPVLNACASLRAIKDGRIIHHQIVRSGCESDAFVRGSLVGMYAKCGSLEDAWRVFNKMPESDVVVWNAMLLGYVKSGEGQKALDLFRRMQEDGVDPDPVTFVSILNACSCVGALNEGKHVHTQIICRGLEPHVFVGSGLVNMYAKCGSIEDAYGVFSRLTNRDIVTWNALILGYVKCGQGEKALNLYREMQAAGVQPDAITFVGFLNACAGVGALEEGRHLHAQIIQSGCLSDVFVGSSLVDMYAKCGSIEDAWNVFKKMPEHDVVTWNSMILGYLKCGQVQKALALYRQMQGKGVDPDQITFVAILNACASVASLEGGKCVHEQIVGSGCDIDIFVGNSLVDMYAKCGSIEDAWRVFNEMPSRDVVAWNAMILSYVKCGTGQKALKLFRQMQEEQVEPDRLTFVGVLNACACTAALEEGRHVHAQSTQSTYRDDVFVGNSIIDMYSKCGSIEDAWSVFSNMHTHNVVSWNCMLGGYATHGHAKEALGLFERMCEAGVEIDRVTFLSLLCACSNGSLVDEGQHYFESMRAVYGISSTTEHHASMVNLLGHAGRLHEAKDMLNRMVTSEPDVILWRALLGACRAHGNVEMGEGIAKRLLQLDPGNASNYVLLSNIYAAAGKWDSSADARQQKRIEM